jgi:hypothetical protein
MIPNGMISIPEAEIAEKFLERGRTVLGLTYEPAAGSDKEKKR